MKRIASLVLALTMWLILLGSASADWRFTYPRHILSSGYAWGRWGMGQAFRAGDTAFGPYVSRAKAYYPPQAPYTFVPSPTYSRSGEGYYQRYYGNPAYYSPPRGSLHNHYYEPGGRFYAGE